MDRADEPDSTTYKPEQLGFFKFFIVREIKYQQISEATLRFE
jgi:hypothetical protein